MGKNRKIIILRIAKKKFSLRVRRNKKKKKGRKSEVTFETLLERALSESTKYLFSAKESPLYFPKITARKIPSTGNIKIPTNFSIIDNPKETYQSLREIVETLLMSRHQTVIIDYSKCNKFTIEAQVLLDIILKDILKFYRMCQGYRKFEKYSKQIVDRTNPKSTIRKMLFSVGSQAIHTNKQKDFPDVIPYNLCIHHRSNDNMRQIEQKELDTTSLGDYVEECLARMGRKLDSETLDDLYTVIGEILINAEEHSSTHCRYSIGYFEEKDIENKHVGLFQLVIMNLGRSIYEKFHDADCPNKVIVDKMKSLSEKYAKRRFWQRNVFDEETLWTLYSLQDGVTSVSPQQFSKRGNGSGRFIEGFFNLKDKNKDISLSKMTLQSGNANIIFDGSYGVMEKIINGEKYKVMTFNTSGNIDEKPDTKYVRRSDFNFPGTFICANIIL